jgi:hypothetical protein
MKANEYRMICNKHHAAMDSFGYIYTLSDTSQIVRLGKIIYKISTEYYHIESRSGKKLEGQKSFESALLLLIGHKDY